MILNDPGTFAHLGKKISPGAYIYKRLNHSLNTVVAKENPLISLVFQGHVPEKALPPYLTVQGTDVIKTRLQKLSWKRLM